MTAHDVDDFAMENYDAGMWNGVYCCSHFVDLFETVNYLATDALPVEIDVDVATAACV